MTVERINETQYANIYGIYDDSGKAIGTVEERLAGRDVGTYYYSLDGRYKKRDIKTFFLAARKEQ